jgi:DNA polymerase III alpha subunit
MNYDKLGVAHASSDELCDLLYLNPDLDLSRVSVTDPEKYNNAVQDFYADLPILTQYQYQNQDISIEQFDRQNQDQWSMPDEYKNMDIAQWILDQCKTQEELQRVGKELLLYQERDLFLLLKQLKYIVDTWRANNVLWGVGRGSSVASYVLYLLGVHRINSMYYDLDIEEFLR